MITQFETLEPFPRGFDGVLQSPEWVILKTRVLPVNVKLVRQRDAARGSLFRQQAGMGAAKWRTVLNSKLVTTALSQGQGSSAGQIGPGTTATILQAKMDALEDIQSYLGSLLRI
jgi:hypothetical protein